MELFNHPLRLRADPARARHRGGSGLGLSIVDAAVSAHSGRVLVTSAPGAGTVLVYAAAGCAGDPVARGTAAELRAGLTVAVADDTSTEFSAVAIGGIFLLLGAFLGFIAGDQFNVLSRLSGLPSLPVSGQSATAGAVISIVAVAVDQLAGIGKGRRRSDEQVHGRRP